MRIFLNTILTIFFSFNQIQAIASDDLNNFKIKNQLDTELKQLKDILADQVIEFKSKTLIEVRLDELYKIIINMSAHDPIVLVTDIPQENYSMTMTTKAQESFASLTKIVETDLNINTSPQWKNLQRLLNSYFELRNSGHYKKSREILKTGALKNKFTEMKEIIASKRFAQKGEIIIRNISIENSLEKINSLENTLLKNESKKSELGTDNFNWTSLIIFFSALQILVYFYTKKSMSKKEELLEVQKQELVEQYKNELKSLQHINKADQSGQEYFYYDQWLEKFDKVLSCLEKEIEATNYEKNIVQKYMFMLSEATVGLAIAQNQAEYNDNMFKLNEANESIKAFVEEKIVISDNFKDVIRLTFQLSRAVEKNKKIIISTEEFNLNNQTNQSHEQIAA